MDPCSIITMTEVPYNNEQTNLDLCQINTGYYRDQNIIIFQPMNNFYSETCWLIN